MNPNNTQNKFLTESLYLAAYLISKDCKFLGINRTSLYGKAQFIFEDPDNSTQEIADKYFGFEGQTARNLFHALKDLRSLLHEDKGEI